MITSIKSTAVERCQLSLDNFARKEILNTTIIPSSVWKMAKENADKQSAFVAEIQAKRLIQQQRSEDLKQFTTKGK